MSFNYTDPTPPDQLLQQTQNKLHHLLLLDHLIPPVSSTASLDFTAGVQAESGVTLSSHSICAVTESTVTISCTFITPNSSSVSEREWFLIHNPDEEEEQVLKKDPDFSGRFYYSKWRHICDLTLKDVRVSDSGVYNFRFKTSSSDWISASSGVNLTVTDLQVKVENKTVGQRKVKVTCSSTCSLSENLYYFWYKDEEHMPNARHDSYIHLDSTSPSDQGSYSCQVSVSLHRSPLMCLKIRVSHTDSGGKKLICSSTCPLTDHYTYIWYRNGQPVYGESYNEFYIDDSTVDAGSFSCAVRGYEKLLSPAVYSPRPPSVSEHVSGDSVILMCVSDSNPPSSYTWYYKTGSDVILVGNSRSLTLTAGKVGLFFCKADNLLGSYNSSDWLMTSTENTAGKYAASGVAVVLFLIFIAVFLCMRRKRGAERDTHIQSLNPADDTYTALNLATISSDYDTLQGVKTSHSEQNTVMQRRASADSADYEDVL